MAVASSVHKKPMVGRFPLEDIHRRNSSGGGITAYGYSKVNFYNNDSKLIKRFDSIESCFSSTCTSPSRVVTVLAFSVFFGLRAFNIFVRVFFGLSGLDYYVNEGYLVAGVDIDTS